MLKTTTAQKKIAKLRKRIRIVRGGTSASKTFSIIPFLIDYAVKNPKSEISIVSETIPHLKRGAIRDFLKILDLVGMMDLKKWNKSNLTYTFTNGSFIEFFSADQPDKLRGARRDILFINECNNVLWESYYQLAIRTRKFIYLDFNPVNEFWVDTELINDIDAEIITLTYKDNEALEKSIIDEIEKAREKGKTSEYWANWWKVYGLGQVGTLQGTILTDWKTIDNIPEDAKYLGSGMDFGFTNDPTTLVDLYSYNGQPIFDERLYQKGLTNGDIARFLKSQNYNGSNDIYADSSEPKSIKEINEYGFNVKGATKGKDSIVFGLDVLQQQTFLVTSSSVNLIAELRKYAWDVDRNGNKLNKPIDSYNHCIDSARYISIEKLTAKKPTSKIIW